MGRDDGAKDNSYIIKEILLMADKFGFLNGKHILVTGGAGAIGSNLVRFFSNYKCKIAVIDDLSSGDQRNLPELKNIIFKKASILDDKALEEIFSESINYVFHLAAHFANQNSVDHPREDLLVNTLGTLKLLQYSQKAPLERFVYTSSSCVYGDGTKKKLTEDLVTKLETPYAISKLAGEEYVHFFNRQYRLPTTVVRYFNAYGPGDPPGKYRNVIPNFFLRAMRRQPLVITGTGEEKRDFTFMDDIVRGTLLTLTTEQAIGHVYNVGSGRAVTIKKLAGLINEIAANPAGVKFTPRRKWDTIKVRLASIDKSLKHTGYMPQVRLEDGLSRTWEWFRQRYRAQR
jgi:nucleoside-diphosphate-sugar epimerase